jgi:hypothetical protein
MDIKPSRPSPESELVAWRDRFRLPAAVAAVTEDGA